MIPFPGGGNYWIRLDRFSDEVMPASALGERSSGNRPAFLLGQGPLLALAPLDHFLLDFKILPHHRYEVPRHFAGLVA